MTQKDKSQPGDLWVPLGDLAVQQARCLNTRTGELRLVVLNQVKPKPGTKTVAGLRMFLLKEIANGNFEETGEESRDPKHYSICTDMYHNNGYIYDPPNIPLETADTDPEREAMRARLEQQMAMYPYAFKITGLQRRYLWYFNGGNAQQLFQTLSFKPGQTPFNPDGTLRSKYSLFYSSQMQAAKAPHPREHEQTYGETLEKCLYRGVAWVVRFSLDDQDVLPGARAYVDDEGTFLCSDWCQRHDYTSYHTGVNLQMGIYNLAGWIVGSCLQKVQREFRPAAGKATVTQLRAAIAEGAVVVPTFAELQKEAEARIRAEIPKDHLPITPDVLIPDVMTKEVQQDAEGRARAHFSKQMLRAMRIVEQRTMLDALRAKGKVEGGAVELPSKDPSFVTITSTGTLVVYMVVPEQPDQELGPAIAVCYRLQGKRAKPGHERAEFMWVSAQKLYERGTPMANVRNDFKKLQETQSKKVGDDPVKGTSNGWWLALDEDGTLLYGGASLSLIDGIEPCFPNWHGYPILKTYKDEILPTLVTTAQAAKAEEPNDVVALAR